MTGALIFLVGGALGGLMLGALGVGTALIAVPLLTLVLPWLGVPAESAPLTALATSMAVVAVTSVSSVLSHHRLGNVEWPVFRVTILASLAGVALGSAVATHLPAAALRLAVGGFLLYTAWRMVVGGKAKSNIPSAGMAGAGAYRLGGALIGVAGSFIGAGGGVLMVPFLSGRGHAMTRAVATSTAIGLPVTVLGAMLYTGLGLRDGVHLPGQIGYLHLPAFLEIGVASALTAPFGARLASRIPAALLKRIFAVLLVPLALKIAVG
ncbi:sulfite exporter TauE/SafE family protein [Azospirillum doebereinerae]|uniref:Probable membrane transporter protein n=1 Tax=Azospirillum doebereinerae TaxID=92933 RepID=A0A3S0X2K3_9PROT|nr:sulfite exporter TauE/SafE family protein [Azospirillum doebereinerae]MCG5241061.1 sulfite exporter TauE/SafE family protein [Azospirillum doebereinerae]RUQ76042.1 sulfite exporter TauE/SafE family protein [Azospirillum doebereinerae]